MCFVLLLTISSESGTVMLASVDSSGTFSRAITAVCYLHHLASLKIMGRCSKKNIKQLKRVGLDLDLDR